MRNNPLMSKEREDELEKKVHKDLLGKRRVGSKWNSVKDKLPDNPNKRKKYLCTNGYEMFVTEYRDYAHRVFCEYIKKGVSEEAYIKGRRDFLSMMLDKDIFETKFLVTN